MKQKIIKGAVFALFAIVSANANAASFMPNGSATSQPIGHYEFCQSNPSECGVKAKKPGLVHLTPALWNSLQDVNNSVNVMIEPVTDEDLWGKLEIWSYPTNKGDCEDFVLLKRKLLMEQGVPASNLLITVVRQRNGDGHAVLAVRTDRGDFILDNLEPKIKSWEKTDYKFLKRQSERNTNSWVSIQDSRPIVVSSIKP